MLCVNQNVCVCVSVCVCSKSVSISATRRPLPLATVNLFHGCHFGMLYLKKSYCMQTFGGWLFLLSIILWIMLG